MSFLIEQAGGQAVSISLDGKVTRALEIKPTNLHQREPVWLGCKRDVDLIQAFFAGDPPKPAAKKDDKKDDKPKAKL